MKKSLPIILSILLLAGSSWAFMAPSISGSGVSAAAGGGCTYGDNTGSANGGLGTSGAYSMLWEATCTEDLKTITIGVVDVGSWAVRVAVYLDDGDNVRGVGDTLIEEATDSGSGVNAALVITMAGNNTHTSGNKYWIVTAANGVDTVLYYTATSATSPAYSSGYDWTTGAPANITNDGGITWTAQSRQFNALMTLGTP